MDGPLKKFTWSNIKESLHTILVPTKREMFKIILILIGIYIIKTSEKYISTYLIYVFITCLLFFLTGFALKCMECKDKDGFPVCKNENDIGTSRTCTDDINLCLTVNCEDSKYGFTRGCAATVWAYWAKLALEEAIKVGAHTP